MSDTDNFNHGIFCFQLSSANHPSGSGFSKLITIFLTLQSLNIGFNEQINRFFFKGEVYLRETYFAFKAEKMKFIQC
jgi:hypothetical protein